MARTEAQKAARRIHEAKPEVKARNKVIAAKSRGKRRAQNVEYQKGYRERNHDLLLEKQKIYNARPEVKSRILAQNKFKQLENFVIEDCPICKINARLVWDHDHESNEFRAYICGTCNTMLGFAKDSVTILASAIEYLNIHSTLDKYNNVVDGQVMQFKETKNAP